MFALHPLREQFLAPVAAAGSFLPLSGRKPSDNGHCRIRVGQQAPAHWKVPPNQAPSFTWVLLYIIQPAYRSYIWLRIVLQWHQQPVQPTIRFSSRHRVTICFLEDCLHCKSICTATNMNIYCLIHYKLLCCRMKVIKLRAPQNTKRN
uniref:Uncharacterized protein n=1 Tax=Spironucleus salmonicida TaxID=348837 RepID=V6LR68_9EUKA|eukprot:EST46738.1 Hypothetical protein SS50377_13254 [Spironucleus salmonicida]